MTDIFAGDGATDPTSPSASGVYVEASSSHDSTIDSTVTGLFFKYAYDAGCAAAGLLPIALLFHGYAGDANSLVQADLRRWAARGFFAVALGMRGRNSATGARDASGRELYDALDLVVHLRATFPTIVHATMAGACGWSGGGGNVLGLRCKTDLFTVSADFFGIADYGLDATYGWYAFGTALGSHALLETDIGGTPSAVPLAYQARDARAAIAKALALGGWLHLLHDTGDTSVSVHASQQVAAALSAAGLANYTYTETTGASTTRALHGHPVDHAELPLLEQIFARRMRDSEVMTIPAAGELLVLGYFRSFTRDFELWVGDAASPRTSATGGTNRRAHVVYDVEAGRYVVTPLDGPSYLYLRHGASFTVESVALTGRTVIVDAVAGTVRAIANDLDGASASWSSGATPAPYVAPLGGMGATVARAVPWHPTDRRGTTPLES